MAVEAVIFDWGGTLTPWRTITPHEEWESLAAAAAPDRRTAVTEALVAAATAVWERSRDEHRSATLEEIVQLADLVYDVEHLQGYRDFWEPATITDEDVPELFGWLRGEGIRVGVLSNTVWPRAWHEEIFVRDGIDHLIDGSVFTSEIAWTKPAPQAFEAAMAAVDVSDAASCVFVGDRLFDDIYGAKNVGMKAVLVPHSEIPASQVGHTTGEPDAVIHRLCELPTVLRPWR